MEGGGHTHQKILTSLKKERKKGTSSQNYQTPNPWGKGGGGSATTLIYDCRNIVKIWRKETLGAIYRMKKSKIYVFQFHLRFFHP